MANEWLKELRDIGVKRAVFSEQNANGEAKLLEVEFFEPTPGFPRLDFDTLVPPAPAVDEPEAPRATKPAPALARLLKNGSVS
jgi:hypothetical protein